MPRLIHNPLTRRLAVGLIVVVAFVAAVHRNRVTGESGLE
jgi:hypothetical protein